MAPRYVTKFKVITSCSLSGRSRAASSGRLSGDVFLSSRSQKKYLKMKTVSVIALLAFAACCNCIEMKKSATVDTKTEAEAIVLSVPEVKSETVQRKGRLHGTNLRDFLNCAIVFDAPCFLDRAEDLVSESNRALWAEADEQAIQSTGRADENDKPSALMKSISELVGELMDMLKDSLSGFLREAKEGEEDEIETPDSDPSEDEEDDDDNEDDKTRDIGESRGKKKKKKKAIIKLLLIGAVIAAKLKLLLKLFATHLQIKFLIIAVASLLINAIRLWVDLKKGHQPQKVIYYEHAQHQHHYEDGPDEDWHGGWSRSYDQELNKKSGQDLAYAQQKPQGLVYSKVDDKPNYSWAN